MNEMVVTEKIAVLPVISFQDEMQQIDKELFVASAAREFAMYRIYRIYKEGLYKERYEHFMEFCAEMNDRYEISKPTIYGRIKSYSSLEWAGYTPEESVKMMIERPFALSQIVNELVTITSTKDIELKAAVEEEKSPQDTLRDVIEMTGSMTMQDASLYIKENLTFEPIVKVIMDAEKIVVTFTEFAPDTSGASEIINLETITFFPDKKLPPYVQTYLKRLSRTV